jgi:hypothetical protein
MDRLIETRHVAAAEHRHINVPGGQRDGDNWLFLPQAAGEHTGSCAELTTSLCSSAAQKIKLVMQLQEALPAEHCSVALACLLLSTFHAM